MASEQDIASFRRTGEVRGSTRLEIQEVSSEGGSGSGSGGSGSAVLVSIIAVEALAKFSVVTTTGARADSANSAHFGKVTGIALADINVGFAGQVQVEGSVSNPYWAWVAGSDLFLNGTTLSSSPPGSGFSQKIGVAQNPTVVILQLSDPVLL